MPTSPAPAELLRTALTTIADFAPQAIELGQRFADAGHELALVGGPVRDAFLGKPSQDLDFATSARPDQTEQILSEWGQATWDMGREFGTIGARRGEAVVEENTYRSEQYQADARKPVVDFGESLYGVLSRTDIIANAIAV